MKDKLNIYYDEEGDFLELHVGPLKKGHYKNLGEGVFQRVDDKTGEVTGVAVMAFKKRTKGQKDIGISLPVNLELSA